MNNVLYCEFLEVKEYTRQQDGSKYFSLRVLVGNSTFTMYFNKRELYDSLRKVDRMSPIFVDYALKIKNDGTPSIVPQDFTNE